MTRDEAINTLMDTGCKSRGWSEGMIDSFVALGMLKLDEPKSPEMRAGEIINAYMSGSETAAVLMELSDAGLKIVEK